MMTFVFITGASGAGKTTVLQALEKALPDASMNYFDSIGVPSPKEMSDPQSWQETTTHEWVKKLADIKGKKLIFLEGQFNPAFAVAALKKQAITDYKIICLHAEKDLREKRLTESRKQPELATNDMENFARFLKEKTLEMGGTVIESSEKASVTAQKIMDHLC